MLGRVALEVTGVSANDDARGDVREMARGYRRVGVRTGRRRHCNGAPSASDAFETGTGRLRFFFLEAPPGAIGAALST